MTVPEWVLSTTQKMLEEARASQATGEPIDMARLELKLSIILVQARARECRGLADSMRVHGVKDLGQMFGWMSQRSSELEAMGLEMAKPGNWPPKADDLESPGANLSRNPNDLTVIIQ